MPFAPQEVTQLLTRARDGDCEARDELLRVTYDELRRLARASMGRQRGHTLEATGLANEVCARLLDGPGIQGANRAQFLAYVAQAMRNLLVDHARARRRNKRGGGFQRVQLAPDLAVTGEPDGDLLALDEALERLASLEPRKSRVVTLRYFGGLSVDETAEAIGVSPATVDRDWEVAKAWLLREIRKGETHEP